MPGGPANSEAWEQKSQNEDDLNPILPPNEVENLGGPYTSINNPKSRYIFRDFECGVKCVALIVADVKQIDE